MERVRATWTDERLDDLSHRVDLGFERMDRRFEHVDSEMRAIRTELGGRIDALQRTMIQAAVAIISANMVVTITLVAALA